MNGALERTLADLVEPLKKCACILVDKHRIHWIVNIMHVCMP